MGGNLQKGTMVAPSLLAVASHSAVVIARSDSTRSGFMGEPLRRPGFSQWAFRAHRPYDRFRAFDCAQFPEQACIGPQVVKSLAQDMRRRRRTPAGPLKAGQPSKRRPDTSRAHTTNTSASIAHWMVSPWNGRQVCSRYWNASDATMSEPTLIYSAPSITSA